MRLVGCLLMVSGWLLLMAALLLLDSGVPQLVFVGAGILVEALGVAVLAHRYRTEQAAPSLRGAR
jgi:hypothetical protein